MSRECIAFAMEEHGLDALIASGESRICAVAAAAGFACGALPLGYADFNGRAFGVHVITKDDSTWRMLNIMGAWEATFPEGTKVPELLKD